ncbi:hypothetical protein KXD40_005444 [Peronospora effusa]|uniref:Protein kinase domain-containing protein n=1 Tax=Peronospora effusa TaxID=542832 RepID=A0A3M6VPF1_9STRA|nr:hypothetical protein DD238_000571 [Peronospora effusa]UIZ27649.1 hypothetical protein KXD40_005444 [Peronospora effusa]
MGGASFAQLEVTQKRRRRQRTTSLFKCTRCAVLNGHEPGVRHKLGIAHRNISPQNIMLDQERCKIGDCGLLHR